MPVDVSPPALNRRSLAGWLLLTAIAALLVLYGYILSLVMHPRLDEAYRRTFVTSEFSVYPLSAAFKPGEGLDYTIGTHVDFRDGTERNWLSRNGWQRSETPVVRLRGTSGRIYLHLIGEKQPSAHRHKLTLLFNCRPWGRRTTEIANSVNGIPAGTVDCGDGAVSIEADLPAGRLGADHYDEIEIARAEGSLFEHIATRIGLRARTVELTSMVIEAEPDGGPQ